MKQRVLDKPIVLLQMLQSGKNGNLMNPLSIDQRLTKF